MVAISKVARLSVNNSVVIPAQWLKDMCGKGERVLQLVPTSDGNLLVTASFRDDANLLQTIGKFNKLRIQKYYREYLGVKHGDSINLHYDCEKNHIIVKKAHI